jgi:predicted N-formylglutamate amidohydrolase
LKASASKIIITCEHGGNRVPREYRDFFKGENNILRSHRGYDAGALILARELARKLDARLFYSETTRLLVDLNRSLHHRDLFSEFSRNCDTQTKGRILAKYYLPYRNTVGNEIAKSKKPVIHLSIHSFTSRLGRQTRNADVGLLYDPARKPEREFCRKLLSSLHNHTQHLIIRRNCPYRGTADGFTTHLRKNYPGSKYIGVEIEINQKHVQDPGHWKNLRKAIIDSIASLTAK